jgi:DNA repair exonuclease SbcCD nuclease subunit
MRLQYISDIHLETRNEKDFAKYLIPNAPYLALCGDIGYPHSSLFKEFIEYCSIHWTHVFYIAGNHDYYNKIYSKWKYSKPYSMNEIEDYIESLFINFPNVHFLQEKKFNIPNTNYVILGCTLWTSIPEDKYINCIMYSNDVNYISTNSIERLSPKNINDLHVQHSNWLLKELDLAESENKKAIVLTHHLPTELLVSYKYIGDPQNYLYFTELASHLNKSSLQAWICGHSHSAKRIKFNKNKELMMNCKGYNDEKIDNFNPSCIYEIKDKLPDLQMIEDVNFI